jgi:hypothetical protein
MSSILKVDQLKDSGGNAIITSNGSGTFTSSLPNTGITEADQWRVTANITANVNPISANLERNDSPGFAYLGTGMTVSSGIWTFPSTGLWSITSRSYTEAVPNDNVVMRIYTTTDNSSYTEVSLGVSSGDSSTTGGGTNVSNILFNVTDTSTHKLKFGAGSLASGSYFHGDTTRNYTYFTFIRLGDSV